MSVTETYRVQMPSSDGSLLWESYLSPYWFPSVLVADDLGIPAELAASPATADELSERMHLNPRAVGAVLPMLASLGYLVAHGGQYAISDAGRHYLLPSSFFYWGGVLRANRRNPQLAPMCDRLEHVMRTPDPREPVPSPSSDDSINVNSWASGEIAPDAARSMIAYMQSHSATVAVSLAQNADFSRTKRLLDVGGCSGVYSIELARRYPDLHCTVLDLPSVCEVAREHITASGLDGQVETFAADMFRHRWPMGYDAVLFANILHDWQIETCNELVRRTFEALGPGGTINIQEILLNDDGSGPREAAAFGVHMVIGTRGQHFTFGRLREMLDNAGFVEVECISTSPLYSLVRARKP